MSDLAERLHKYIADHSHPAVTSPALILLTEAAGRIEQLQAALREIDNMAPATCDVTLAHQMADCARAALEPEK